MTDLADLPPALDVGTVAELLGVSRWLVYEAVKRGQIPALHVGRTVRVPRRAVLELLGEVEATTPAPPSQADVVGLRRGAER